ncbi:MAG TPA: methylmalonyl Co-A mutase-associated GTPase MeaB [Candidatus Polarisedimenticolaceae bacterium]|nr:methylmalonyl Co-A mutase-associated GTPase MeaB [Candidatus Polarisedimenticolaceae bacterium]
MPTKEALLAGDVRALARAISLVEDQQPAAVELLRAIFPHTGAATVIGLTGAPGSGKSSLVDRLAARYRATDHKVGIIAVDPSSAFSGGAILGDRIRMQSHTADPSVFIRSMATRGHLGGLARATNDAIDLMDAAGFDPVIVETVGVGQDEVDVVKTADVVAVVLVPGMGDDIQAIKAGILEIADLFVINKADHKGADRLQADLAYMLELTDRETAKPEILRTVAIRNEGIDRLHDGIASFMSNTGRSRRRERRRDRAEARFRAVLVERLLRRVVERALPADELGRLIDAIAARELDPYTAAERVTRSLE